MALRKVDWAQEFLDLRNRQAVYRYVRERVIPLGCVVRVGRSLRFDEDAMRRWVERGGRGLEEPDRGAAA